MTEGASNLEQPRDKYSGVQALFNADLHAVAPNWARREEWIVITPFAIRWTQVSEETRQKAAELTNKARNRDE